MQSRYFHWAYVWIPVFGAFVWFGTLLAMLITWLVQGMPIYESMDGRIAFISDIGADFLKPLFVTGCAITAVCFWITIVIERWLRHSGRLMPNMRTRERVFSVLSAIFSFVGGAGLILLAVFDTMEYPMLHRLFLLIFMLGVILSALFTVIEYRWISKEFTDVHELRKSYVTKALIAGILFLLSIGFGVGLSRAIDVGGVFEWVIAFGFTFYLLTFYYDLRQSKGVPRGALKSERVTMFSRTRRERQQV